MRDNFKTVPVDVRRALAEKIDKFAQQNNISRTQAVNLVIHYSLDLFTGYWENCTNAMKEAFTESMEKHYDISANKR